MPLSGNEPQGSPPPDGEPKNEAPFTRHIGNPAQPLTPKQHLRPSVRAQLHSLMAETAGNRYGWHYAETRPLTIPTRLAYHVEADCSFACKILCHWAGAPDPTGRSFDGYGNSVSMCEHLTHIDLAYARVGDFLVFGPQGEWHATMIYAASPDNPVLWSHGHEGAPNFYPLSADSRRPITALRNPIP